MNDIEIQWLRCHSFFSEKVLGLQTEVTVLRESGFLQRITGKNLLHCQKGVEKENTYRHEIETNKELCDTDAGMGFQKPSRFVKATTLFDPSWAQSFFCPKGFRQSSLKQHRD
jgi:hypothetical protein